MGALMPVCKKYYPRLNIIDRALNSTGVNYSKPQSLVQKLKTANKIQKLKNEKARLHKEKERDVNNMIGKMEDACLQIQKSKGNSKEKQEMIQKLKGQFKQQKAD